MALLGVGDVNGINGGGGGITGADKRTGTMVVVVVVPMLSVEYCINRLSVGLLLRWMGGV